MFGLDMVAELNLALQACELDGIFNADGKSTFQYGITGLHSSQSTYSHTLKLTLGTTTPCPEKKEASGFSTISLAFLDRFL